MVSASLNHIAILTIPVSILDYEQVIGEILQDLLAHFNAKFSLGEFTYLSAISVRGSVLYFYLFSVSVNLFCIYKYNKNLFLHFNSQPQY